MNLLELCFALLLTAILALGAFSGLHLGVHAHRRFVNREQNEHRLAKLEQVLRDEMQLAQTIYPFRGIRVQRNAVLTLPFVQPVLPKNYRPAAHSDALTFATPVLDYMFRAVETSPRAESAAAPNFCLDIHRTESGFKIRRISSYQLYLAVGIDGFVEIEGSLVHSHGSIASCPSTKLFQATFRKMNFPFHSTATDGMSPLLLIPLSDLFTIYLDQNKMIRRLSHLNDESQIIAGPFAAFHLEDCAGGPFCSIRAVTARTLAAEPLERLWSIPLRATAEESHLDLIS